MHKQLSASLVNQLRQSVQQAQPVPIYWDYRDQLSTKQIQSILKEREGMAQVEAELYENNCDSWYPLELDNIRTVLKQSLDSIAQELEIEEADVSDDLLTEIIDEYEFLCDSPGVDQDLRQIVHISRPKVVLQIDLFHEFSGCEWNSCVDYESVKTALQLFNVNPRKVHKSFPDLPYRNGHEYLLPKDVRELWDNATYGGRYVVPIQLDLWEYYLKRDQYHTGIILHKGSEIWMHDYLNGSGSISVPLQKGLLLFSKRIKYRFVDDNQSHYGLEEVYGPSSAAWQNVISPTNLAVIPANV